MSIFVATGCSSGLGFAAIKKLLLDGSSQPYRFILAARNVSACEKAFSDLQYDSQKHSVSTFKADFAQLSSVRSFAEQALRAIGDDKIDCVFLNAGIVKAAKNEDTQSRWSETARVNWLSQHLLLLLLEKSLAKDSRLVFVNSGASRMVKDLATVEPSLKANSGADWNIYPNSKVAQLLNAHWWKRHRQGNVVAVSPGLVPGTGLGRDIGIPPGMDDMSKHPDAISVDDGAQALLNAVFKQDLPTDDRIFLSSKNTWASVEEYSIAYDKAEQDKWSPSLKDIEAEQ